MKTAICFSALILAANLLWFQSHFYLSIIFAFLLIQLAAAPPHLSSLFWFSLVGVLNSFTSAAAPVPLMVSLAVQVIALFGFNTVRSRLSLSMIGMNVLLLALSVFLMVSPEAAEHCGSRE